MGQLLIPPLHRNRSETTSSIHLSSGPAQRESLGEILREGTGKREVISQRCLSVPGYGAQCLATEPSAWLRGPAAPKKTAWVSVP